MMKQFTWVGPGGHVPLVGEVSPGQNFGVPENLDAETAARLVREGLLVSINKPLRRDKKEGEE